jgi:peptidoglycan/LPS O-acetylase OafA/YrhL
MAWWVVSQHILSLSGYDERYIGSPVIKLLSLGGLAVMVFVIISGFVIANMLIVKNEPYGQYIGRRFWRIYPLYIFAVVSSILLRGFYMDTVAQAPWASPHIAVAVADERSRLAQHIVWHLVLLHGAIPNDILANAIFSLLAPAWSLSLEWQFYLLAPLLVRLLFRSQLVVQFAVCAGLLVSLALLYSIDPLSHWIYPAFLPLTIGFFLLGMITRFYIELRSLKMILLPLIVVAVNFILYCRTYVGGNFITGMLPLLIWAITIYVALEIRKEERQTLFVRGLRVLLASPPAVRLGLWSYSTYLLHVPLFVLILSTARALGMPMTSQAYLTVMLGACSLLVALSWACYSLLEQRVMRWGVSHLPKRPDIIPANS